MRIIADKEGQAVLQQLADIALKQGGIQNLQAVNQFLQSIQMIEETKVDEA